MNFDNGTLLKESQVTIENLLPQIGKQAIVNEITEGLQAKNKYISSKFFYDARGSELFEQITELPEYYPTRTEMPLIRIMAHQLKDQLTDTDIVEIGSGSCAKISLLFETVTPEIRKTIRYIPVDVSQAAITESANELKSTFPMINVHGLVADFLTQLDLVPHGNRRIFCFFGSTIGNFSRDEAEKFFIALSEAMDPGDRLILGLDMVKDTAILENAYNDKKNITAEFNRNILHVVNSVAETDFDPHMFTHVAFYSTREKRVEMHLESREDVYVSSPLWRTGIVIKQGETIHTENSHKFTPDHIKTLAHLGDLNIEKVYTDKNNWFSLVQFIK